MTQTELAKKIGVSAPVISALEKRRSRGAMQTWEKLCKVLNVSLKEMFDEHDPVITSSLNVSQRTIDKNTVDYQSFSDYEKFQLTSKIVLLSPKQFSMVNELVTYFLDGE
jgi:DNA-binding XRE family transcriptional regulator